MVVGELVQEKEVIVIGGGPAGYTAAVRAAQLGKDVLLIEQRKLGGVCLHDGCIPSKTLIHAANVAESFTHMEKIGFKVNKTTFDVRTFQTYQQQLIEMLYKSVEALCKKNQIEVMNGKAAFLTDERVSVEKGHQFEVIHFEQAIIATGAAIFEQDEKLKTQLHPYELFQLEKIPEKLLLIGCDDIIVEAAFAYRKLGAAVSIIMEQDSFPFDHSITKILKRQLKKAKINVYTRASSIQFLEDSDAVYCRFLKQNGEEATLTGTHFYKQVKWLGNTKHLGLTRANVLTDENGFIKIDKQCRTQNKHIFAVGDVTGEPLLAAKGIKAGKIAAEVIAGHKAAVDSPWIPKVVYSDPPIATVGMSEQEAKAAGYSVKVGEGNMQENGYAQILEKRAGIVKTIFDKETERLLGMHMIGEGAGELISTAIVAGEMVARIEDLQYPLYPHPSYHEALLTAVEQSDSCGKDEAGK